MDEKMLAQAKVGLDALIDEATGFQKQRAPDELAKRYRSYGGTDADYRAPATPEERVSVEQLERGQCYALGHISNADGSWASIWRIESIGPRWIKYREWQEGGWSGLSRTLRSGWKRGEPFVRVQEPRA